MKDLALGRYMCVYIYIYPQIDGKVNHHEISRDLLFHLFVYLLGIQKGTLWRAVFFFTVQKTAQKSALHSVPLSLSIYINIHMNTSCIYIYIVNVFMIS